MKKAALLAPIALAVMVGTTEARQDALSMSCASAKSLVRSQGSVVFNTGRHTFERVVSSINYCDYDQITENRWIKTRDTRQCAAGLKCISRPSIDND